MRISPDIILEKEKLKNKLNIWKIITLLLLIVLFSTLFANNDNVSSSEYIARINITGLIEEDSKRAEKIRRIADNKRIKAVLIKINSGGGTTYGSEELYNALKYVADKKPTISLIGTMAASGGYLAALASNTICAGKMSITGSIGTLMQSFNTKEMLEKLGIKTKSYKSSEYKNAPSIFEDTTPEIDKAIYSTLIDSYETFREIVRERRNLNEEELNAIADGKIFTGNQALNNKLIDFIGEEEEAINYLIKNQKIKSKIKIKTVKINSNREFLGDYLPTEELKSLLNNFLTSKFFVKFDLST